MSGTCYQLRCAACGEREVCRIEEIPRRLAGLRMLRRADTPDDPVWGEMLRHAAPQLHCAACGGAGLEIVEFDASGQDEWESERVCANCRAAIPGERVELFPHVTLCVACQSAQDSGADDGEPDYCPRCGSIVELKPAGSGISRYVLRCPACRWQG